MVYETPEFEVVVKGHSLVKISDGDVKVNGKDFHTDVKNLSTLVDILHDVLNAAEQAKKPRSVAA